MSKKNVPNAVSLRSISSGSRRRSAARPSGRNLKLEIEYDGTNYCGWQVQKGHQVIKFRLRRTRLRRASAHQSKSIQETIEKTLQRILQEKIRLIASGRTDAGVHAFGQVANFKTNSNIALAKLQRALNGNLPDDITVNKIEEVDLDFHSRFSAKSKIYRYTILNHSWPSPLLRNTVYFYPYPLDIKLMQKEAQCLLGKHDFKAFCASGSSTKNTTRTIKKITFKKAIHELRTMNYEQKDANLIIIDIEAEGFLYNMARNIVGTLLEIGRRRFPKGSLKKILLAKNRKFAGPAVPARGLCLIKVNY